MNYKHLSKYHSIYRFSIDGDLKAHIEKLPIAYSNQHYIYVIQPGSDELTRLTLKPYSCYDRSDVHTEINEEIQKKIRMHVTRNLREYGTGWGGTHAWFLLDDPKPLQDFAEKFLDAQIEKEDLLDKKEKAQREVERLTSALRRAKNDLNKIDDALSSLSDMVDPDSALPEGVTLG